MTSQEPPKIASFVAPAADQRKVAEAIASGQPVPGWLSDCAWLLIDMVHGNIERDLDWPNLGSWRERFARLQEAAQLVLDEISDTQKMLPMLLDSPGDWLENEIEMKRGLDALIVRCKEKVTGIPSGKGRKKAAIPFDHTPRSETLCALIVATAWVKIHGDWPSPRNEKTGAACHALWLAAGGAARGGPGSASSWREYLDNAGAMRDSSQARTLITMMAGG